MIDRRGGPSSPGQVWEARKAAAGRAWVVAYIVLLALAAILSPFLSPGAAEDLVDPIPHAIRDVSGKAWILPVVACRAGSLWAGLLSAPG